MSAGKENVIRRSNRLPAVVTLLVPLVLGFATGCAGAAKTTGSSSPGIEKQVIEVDGRERSYYLQLPRDFDSRSKLPLVLVLHGGGKGDGSKAAGYLGFNALADVNGFVLVYPNGVDGYWRDGRGYTHRGESDGSVDDVTFIASLIDHLVQAKKADPKRVYVTGVSNGGMMTLRLGCEISSKLAAIAPVIANLPKNIVGTCQPDAPLPVLLMNGTDDPLVPYGGGYVHFFRKQMGEVVSTDETIAFWVRHNRCNAIPVVTDLPDRDKDDHSKVVVTTYIDANGKPSVVLYAVIGGGHTLPGSNIPNRPRILGQKNNDIDGAEVIWEFLRNYSR